MLAMHASLSLNKWTLGLGIGTDSLIPFDSDSQANDFIQSDAIE